MGENRHNDMHQEVQAWMAVEDAETDYTLDPSRENYLKFSAALTAHAKILNETWRNR